MHLVVEMFPTKL